MITPFAIDDCLLTTKCQTPPDQFKMSFNCCEFQWQTSRNWIVKRYTTFDDFVSKHLNILKKTRYKISGIVWDGGIRRKVNYRSSSWYIAEYDKPGVALKDMLDGLSGINYIIHTSKNHQKPKNEEPACDRYHVLLPFCREVQTCDEHEHIYKALLNNIFIGADQIVWDGARYFSCADDCAIYNNSTGVYLDVDAIMRVYPLKNDQKINNSSPSNTSKTNIPNKKLQIMLTEEYEKRKQSGAYPEHTRDQIFSLLLYGLRLGVDSNSVSDALVNLPFVCDFFERHPENKRQWADTLARAEAAIKSVDKLSLDVFDKI